MRVLALAFFVCLLNLIEHLLLQERFETLSFRKENKYGSHTENAFGIYVRVLEKIAKLILIIGLYIKYGFTGNGFGAQRVDSISESRKRVVANIVIVPSNLYFQFEAKRK